MIENECNMNQAETSRLYEYQYQFDAGGNRTRMDFYNGSITGTTTYNYNNGNQMTRRHTSAALYLYTYDKNGNLTNEKIDDEPPNPTRNFTWNDDNRLKYILNYSGGKQGEYIYDALGRRLMKEDIGNEIYTYYYYDGLTVIAEKKRVQEGTPTWDRVFTVGPGVIGNIFRISTWNGSYWADEYYHYDAIGNVVMKSNSSWGVVASYDQEAYGNVKVGSQSGYHLTTKEYDSHPELYYFCQRWYDSILGIFVLTSPLPINEEHPFQFCSNNSLNNVDVTGLKILPSGSCNEAILRAYDYAIKIRNIWKLSDKWMHCYVGCEAGRAHCPRWYLASLSYLKELSDYFRRGGDSSIADHNAVLWGYDNYCVGCEATCREKYDSNRWLIIF